MLRADGVTELVDGVSKLVDGVTELVDSGNLCMFIQIPLLSLQVSFLRCIDLERCCRRALQDVTPSDNAICQFSRINIYTQRERMSRELRRAVGGGQRAETAVWPTRRVARLAVTLCNGLPSPLTSTTPLRIYFCNEKWG